MISRDFEKGGFPICKRAPALCYSSEGKIYVAYNRYTLHMILNSGNIVKMVGVWPGKKNTDIYVMNIDTYKGIPIPPAEYADIDSAEEVTLYYNAHNDPIALTFRSDPSDSFVTRLNDPNLCRYVVKAGIKHKMVHGEP